MDNLIPVTADLIEELRSKGKHYEASKLLREYRENNKKNRIQLRREIEIATKKIETHIAKKIGLCPICKKRNPNGIRSKIHCTKCLNYAILRGKKWKE